MWKKKLFGLVLALAMVFAVAACTQTAGNDDIQSGVSDEQIEETYGNWDGKALEITAQNKGMGVEWLQQAATIFNRATGSEITVRPDETLNEALATYMMAESGSDVYFSYSSELQWVQWAMQGRIVPVNDLGLNYRDDMAKIGVYDGVRYIMPYVYPPTGFVYNQDYIDEIPSNGEFTQGKFPSTWQGLLDMCISINEQWNKIVLGQKVVPFSWGATVDDMSYIFKGLWGQIDPEGFDAYWNQSDINVSGMKNRGLLVNDNTIKAIDSIAKLLNPQQNVQGNYYPANSFSDSTGHSNLMAEQRFLNGLSVFTISGSWFETEMAEQIEDQELDFYHFATLPIVNEGSSETVYINTPSEYFMIAQNGKNKNFDLAKAFLRYLASEERLQVFHALTGVPAALKYEAKTDTLTDFAKEIADAAARSHCVVSASDQLPSLSGAIRLNTTSTFQQLATSAYTDSSASKVLEDLYAKQYADWDDCFDSFQ